MGVLDKESRDVLMEEYFPGLSERLSCSVSLPKYARTRTSKLEPFASRLYTLTRDPEAQSTYVNEGYFGIQLNE